MILCLYCSACFIVLTERTFYSIAERNSRTGGTKQQKNDSEMLHDFFGEASLRGLRARSRDRLKPLWLVGQTFKSTAMVRFSKESPPSALWVTVNYRYPRHIQRAFLSNLASVLKKASRISVDPCAHLMAVLVDQLGLKCTHYLDVNVHSSLLFSKTPTLPQIGKQLP